MLDRISATHLIDFAAWPVTRNRSEPLVVSASIATAQVAAPESAARDAGVHATTIAVAAADAPRLMHATNSHMAVSPVESCLATTCPRTR